MTRDLRIGYGPPLPSPQRGRWIAKPRRPRFGLVYAGFIGIYAQVFVQLPHLFTSGSSPYLSLSFILPALFVIVWFCLRQLSARKVRPEDLAMMDGAFGDQFIAELTIVANGKRIGADRGVVWFSEGLMGFSGRASSFVLAACDLQPVYEKGQRLVRNGRNYPLGTLLLAERPADSYIVLTPLSGYEKSYRDRQRRFFWFDERPEGERFWPPLEPYNEAITNEIARQSRG